MHCLCCTCIGFNQLSSVDQFYSRQRKTEHFVKKTHDFFNQERYIFIVERQKHTFYQAEGESTKEQICYLFLWSCIGIYLYLWTKKIISFFLEPIAVWDALYLDSFPSSATSLAVSLSKLLFFYMFWFSLCKSVISNYLISPGKNSCTRTKCCCTRFCSHHLGNIVMSYLPSSENEITLTALHTYLFFRGSTPDWGCTRVSSRAVFCLNFNVIKWQVIKPSKENGVSNKYICDTTQLMEMLLLDCRAVTTCPVVMTILLVTAGRREDDGRFQCLRQRLKY